MLCIDSFATTLLLSWIISCTIGISAFGFLMVRGLGSGESSVKRICVVGAPVLVLTLILCQRFLLLFGHLGVRGPPALLP